MSVLSCEIAKLENGGSWPWFIIERVATSDGVRSRVCDGVYKSYADAKKACDYKNRFEENK